MTNWSYQVLGGFVKMFLGRFNNEKIPFLKLNVSILEQIICRGLGWAHGFSIFLHELPFMALYLLNKVPMEKSGKTFP